MALPFILGIRVVILRSKVRGVSARALGRFAARAQRAAGVRGEVNVLITSSAHLRRLNRRFRGKDKATDVLSFPTADGTAGDIAVSAELGVSNARRLGHGAADEFRILILHGLLHLAGYDHETDSGQMERKEARLRRVLGLPAALIERATETIRRNGTRRDAGQRRRS
jgi:probable rRNA maturation factor